jgi:hypothetical protein
MEAARNNIILVCFIFFYLMVYKIIGNITRQPFLVPGGLGSIILKPVTNIYHCMNGRFDQHLQNSHLKKQGKLVKTCLAGNRCRS